MRTKDKIRAASWGLAALCLAGATPIVIRHDRADEEYRALGARYADVHVEIRVPRRDGTQGRAGNGLGTLIGPAWVLTASHVAADLPVALREANGDAVHNVTVNGREHRVQRVFVHPDYLREPSSRSDIALVQLAEPVENARYAHLYPGDDETGHEVIFIGTGVTGTGRNGAATTDRVLRGATNRVDRTDEHRLYFTFDAPGSAAATHLEGISGPGDSGNGALIHRNDSIYVVGVGCCQRHSGTEGVYGVTEVYPRVARHAAWINQVMERANAPVRSGQPR